MSNDSKPDNIAIALCIAAAALDKLVPTSEIARDAYKCIVGKDPETFKRMFSAVNNFERMKTELENCVFALEDLGAGDDVIHGDTVKAARALLAELEK